MNALVPSRRVLLSVPALILALAFVLVRPLPAQAAEWWDGAGAKWFDGRINYSQVLNCYSVIQSSPYYEAGIGAYAGYVADPDNGHPAVGEKGWIHYSVYGLGNPCPGGSYFTPTFYLPSGMGWDRTRPIYCGYDSQSATSPAQACPGWDHMDATNTYWNNMPGDGGNMWGVAQGHHWEFQLPVTFTQAMANAPMQMHLNVADGNHNPQMLLEAPIYVFSSSGGTGAPASGPVGVMYDQPSSWSTPWVDEAGTVPTRYGMLSAFQSVVGGRGGVARLEISTSPTMSSLLGAFEMSFPANTYSSINVWTDWDEPAHFPALSPGTTYYWRGIIKPAGEAAVTGSIQSFTLKSGGGVVAGEPLSETPGNGPGQPPTGGGLNPVITPIQQPFTASFTSPAKASVSKPVKVKVTCSKACAGTVKVTVTKKMMKRLRLRSRTLGSAKVSMGAAGTTTVKVRFPSKVRRAVARVGRTPARATLAVTSGSSGVGASKAIRLVS